MIFLVFDEVLLCGTGFGSALLFPSSTTLCPTLDVEIALVDEEEVTVFSCVVKGLERALEVDGVVKIPPGGRAHQGWRCGLHFWRQVGCNENTDKKLVQSLCLATSLPVVDVPDNKELGEWAGLCEMGFWTRWILRVACLCFSQVGIQEREPGSSGESQFM